VELRIEAGPNAIHVRARELQVHWGEVVFIRWADGGDVTRLSPQNARTLERVLRVARECRARVVGR
jgi:hypothetical protein